MADQGILLNLLKTRTCRCLFTTLLRDTLRVYLLFDPISSKLDLAGYYNEPITWLRRNPKWDCDTSKRYHVIGIQNAQLHGIHLAIPAFLERSNQIP